jgi:hypothetical protein
MKNEGTLRMRFLRHSGIYRSDVSSHLVTLGRSTAFRSGPGQALERAGRKHALPVVAMSSDRLFLNGLLASIARLCFTGITSVNLSPHRLESFIIER